MVATETTADITGLHHAAIRLTSFIKPVLERQLPSNAGSISIYVHSPQFPRQLPFPFPFPPKKSSLRSIYARIYIYMDEIRGMSMTEKMSWNVDSRSVQFHQRNYWALAFGSNRYKQYLFRIVIKRTEYNSNSSIIEIMLHKIFLFSS